MIPIEFISKNPSDPFVLAAWEPSSHPLLQSKPCELAVEIWQDKRVLIMRRPQSIKQGEELGSCLFKKMQEGIERHLVIDIRGHETLSLDVVTGLLLVNWRFDKYRTRFQIGEEICLQSLSLLCNSPSETKQLFASRLSTIQGVLYARCLTSEPPNRMVPERYAEKIRELEQYGVRVEVLDRSMLKTHGMEAILAVGKGSVYPPCVVILHWEGAHAKQPPIVVVGKGVCFDAGGVCLKPPKAQLDMKWDKAGAGVVAGLIQSLALQKAPIHVVGVLGLAENMPDGGAVRPGDVIHTLSGQTVEIADTDAEGRLILADCLWYAKQRFSPKAMVDLGSLCLETQASLGKQYGGLYSNDLGLVQDLQAAGKRCGEELWELPMGEFFAKQIQSTVADIKNVGLEGCGENGAAAEFLKRFVGDTAWAHIDIAGVAWTHEDLLLAHKGVTGFGVRLLTEWLLAQER